MSDLQQNLLIDAYTNALYQIDTDPPIQFCINTKSTQLEGLFASRNVSNAAFITAFNPKSQRLSQATNVARHKELIEQLRQDQKQFLLGRSIDPKSQWPTEISALVFEISIDEASSLGRQFEQNAILFIDDGYPKLVWIDE